MVIGVLLAVLIAALNEKNVMEIYDFSVLLLQEGGFSSIIKL